MSIFKESFRSFIRKQLAIREKIISKGNNNDSRFKGDTVELPDGSKVPLPGGAFFTNTVQRQCVIRMSSGCDITEEGSIEFAEGGKYEKASHIKGSGLARRYILQGGTLAVDRETLSHSDVTKVEQEKVKNDDNSTTSTETRTRTRSEKYKYKLGNRSGFRGISQNDFGTAYGDPTIRANPGEDYGSVPMPGIKTANIRTKSAYGSLREAKVEFVCHNQRQLEVLELLYMRPGIPILLEWGWTPFIDNKGKRRSDFPFIGDWWISEASMEVINRKIIDAKVATGGNYDALAGMCKNFSYKARPDGGFDCTTEIIAMGEIIENLKGIELSSPVNLVNLSDWGAKESKAADIMEIGLNDFIHFSQTAGGDVNATYWWGGADIAKLINNVLISKGKLYPPSPVSSMDKYFGIDKMSNEELQRSTGNSSSSRFELQKAQLQKFIPPMTKSLGKEDDESQSFKTNAPYIRWDAFCTFLNLHVINKTAVGDPIVTFATTMIVDEDTDSPRVEPLLMSRPPKVILYNNMGRPLNVTTLGEGTSEQRVYPYSVLLGSSIDPTICLFPEQVSVFYDITGNSSTSIFSNALYLGAIALSFGVVGVVGAAIVAGVNALKEAEPYNEWAGKIEITGTDKNIRNIGHTYINLQKMRAIYKEQRYNGEGELNDDFNLYDFIKKIWDDISAASGNQHDFMIHNDLERPGVLRIIDANFQKDEELRDEKIHTLKILSNDTVCRDFSYNSVIPSALSATIGVAVQNPDSVQDLDGASFAALAKGIQSRFHVPVSQTKISPTPLERSKKIEELDKLNEEAAFQLHELARFQRETSTGKNQTLEEDGTVYPDVAEKIAKARQNLNSVSKKITRLQTRHQNDGVYNGTDGPKGQQYYTGYPKHIPNPSVSAVIPLKFNAKLDGIGGITIGNLFKVDPTRLPKGYRAADIGFIVMGEQQQITAGQDWTTEINGQLILLPQESPQNARIREGVRNYVQTAVNELGKDPSDRPITNEVGTYETALEKKARLALIDAEPISDTSNLTGYTERSTNGVIQYSKNKSGEQVKGIVKYSNKNKDRYLLCQPQLEEILKQAARETGLNVNIFSGGQISKADGGKDGVNRIGSARHDRGFGADVWLYRGKASGGFKTLKLNISKAADQADLEAFATACKQGGATGLSMAVGYMNNVGMHVDIAYGNSSNAGSAYWRNPPSWLSTLMRSDIGQPNPY